MFDCPPEIARQLMAASVLLHTCAPQTGPILGLQRAGSDEIKALLGALSQASHDVRGSADEQSAAQEAMATWIGYLDRRLGRTDLSEPELITLSAVRAGCNDPLDNPIQAIFDFVARRAGLLYDKAWPNVRFRVARLGEHPREGRDPFGISGLTMADQQRAEVRLQLHLPSLGPRLFAAIPACLVHECICHVASPRFPRADNESMFAEGFMDWAASFYLRDWEADLPSGLSAVAALEEQELQSVWRQSTSGAAIMRQGGRQAAALLATALQRHHDHSREDAHATVASFAVQMNLVEASLAVKDRWVSELPPSDQSPLAATLLNALKGLIAPADLLL